MKGILDYLQDYIRYTNRKLLFAVSLAVAILVFLNYYFRFYQLLYSPVSFLPKFAGFFFLFTFVFSLSYLLSFLFQNKPFPRQPYFYALLVITPAVFAIKIAFRMDTQFLDLTFPWSRYFQLVSQWPFKAVLACGMVCLLWIVGKYDKPVAGLSSRNFNARPYFILLAAMIPLVALAATTADFQHAYPKLKYIDFIDGHTQQTWLARIFYELSYGMDFFTIEFFFRGFLILGFIRYAGKDAILPMAAFYCTIHFGKPLAECITSFFGGLILGAIIYNTRSIWGGLIVHLGIAWLMEIAAVTHGLLS